MKSQTKRALIKTARTVLLTPWYVWVLLAGYITLCVSVAVYVETSWMTLGGIVSWVVVIAGAAVRLVYLYHVDQIECEHQQLKKKIEQ